MRNFKVGDKVVCIDPSGTDPRGLEELQKGAVYTIRWVGVYGDWYSPAGLCVRLVEIPDRTDPFWEELRDVPFYARRFRPVVERKTGAGMAMLKKLLDPSPLEPVVRTNLEAVK